MFFVGLFTFYDAVDGAQFIQGPMPKPANLADQEGCYSVTSRMVIPFDQDYYPPGQCVRLSCETKGTIYIATCSKVSTEDPACHNKKGDLALSYPDCCDYIACDTLNQI